MNSVTATIQSMQNCFTLSELQHISGALDLYNRTTTSKQQRHIIENLRQIFSLSAQRKAV